MRGHTQWGGAWGIAHNSCMIVHNIINIIVLGEAIQSAKIVEN